MFIKMGKKGWAADIIGTLIKNIIENPKPKTRYVATPNRLTNFTLSGILPDRMMDKLIGKNLDLIKKCIAQKLNVRHVACMRGETVLKKAAEAARCKRSVL